MADERRPTKTIQADAKRKTKARAMDPRWFDADNDSRAHDLREVVLQLKGLTGDYRKNVLVNYRTYDDKAYATALIGMDSAAAASRPSPRDDYQRARLTLNVVKSCVDTACSQVFKSAPKPQFLTTEGDYDQQEQAKALTKYVAGCFQWGKAYEVGQLAGRDGTIAGDGYVLQSIDREKGEVVYDRVLGTELYVDEVDGFYGKPRSLYRVKLVAREELFARYPDKTEEIREAAAATVPGQGAGANDMIEVVCGWHLPSSEDSGDGRYIEAIEHACLYDEEYTHPRFPLSRFQWNVPAWGYRGTGLGDELRGIQIEINRTLQAISKAQMLACVPRVFVESGSSVPSSHITDEIGAIIRFTGQPPVFQTAEAMSGEVYTHLWNLYAKAFEITGIAMSSATGTKPAGLDSAVAQREFNDQASQRLVLMGQRFEAMFVDMAEVTVMLSRELYEDFPELKVKVVEGRDVEELRWKDVDLAEDKYVMQVFPVSALPQTPAGRLAMVQELVQAKFIGPEQAMDLLQFPDLDEDINLMTAARKNAKRQVARILKTGKFEPPDDIGNNDLKLQVAMAEYERIQLTDGVSQDRLASLLRFIMALKTKLAPPPPSPQTSPAGAGPAAPGGAPGPGPAPGPGAPPGAGGPPPPPSPAPPPVTDQSGAM